MAFQTHDATIVFSMKTPCFVVIHLISLSRAERSDLVQYQMETDPYPLVILKRNDKIVLMET